MSLPSSRSMTPTQYRLVHTTHTQPSAPHTHTNHLTSCVVLTSPISPQGVGTVVSGTTLRGLIRLNDTLLLGPDPLGSFLSIAVKSIHRKRMPVKEVRGGQTASFALKKVCFYASDCKATTTQRHNNTDEVVHAFINCLLLCQKMKSATFK